MLNFTKEQVRLITRRFWGSVFTLIIALAVIVQLGREAFPLLKDYSQEISEQLGSQLGVNISIGEVSAHWEGMRPRIDLHNVIVESMDGVRIFKIAKSRGEVDLFASLLRRRIYWQRINLQDLQTEAVQDSHGHWSIKGLEEQRESTGGFVIDDPLDIFLFGRRVEINNLHVDVHFRTGHKTQVVVPSVNLENDQGYHRLTASLEVDDDTQAFSFVVEGDGDPRDEQGFSAKSYLELKNFPMEKVLAALGNDIWDESNNESWREGHRLDMSLWIEGSPAKGLTAHGHMRADGLPVNLPEEISLPTQLSADLNANWHAQEGWNVAMQNLLVAWEEIESPTLNLNIHGRGQQNIGLALDQLVLHDWMDKLKQVGLEKTRAGKVISALNPAGKLENIDLKFVSAEQGYFKLRANLSDGASEAFRGSPRVRSLNAYISVSALKGTVVFDNADSFEIYFPKLYENPHAVTQAKGSVAWHIDRESKKTFIASSALELETSGDKISGQFFTELPFKREYGEPFLTLVLGMKKSSTKNYKNYLPFTIPKTLQRWLYRSIGEAELDNVAFLFDGSTRKKTQLPRSFQLVADVHQGDIAFDEAWPELREVEAKIYLDNKDLSVKVSNASLLGNQVSDATVNLVENKKQSGMSLLIKGHLQSNAKAAMELLQNSPVRQVIGKTFDDWDVKGDVNANLKLRVPLTANAGELEQLVSVDFSKAELTIPNIRLSMKNINGDLHYSSEKGLHSKNLSGSVWGEAFSATIASSEIEKNVNETRINFSGDLGMGDIQTWTGRPELMFISGKTPVKGEIIIPDSRLSDKKLLINMHSDLQGVKLDLPMPLAKNLNESKNFHLQISMFEDRQRFGFTYDDWVKINVLRGSAEINSAQIVFGTETIDAESGFFDITGELREFDLMEWNLAREKYYTYISQLGEQHASTITPLPIRLELNVSSCLVGSLALKDLQVSGFGTQQDWTLFFDSDFLRGRVITYEKDRPVFMDLDHIRFPSLSGSAGGEGDAQQEGNEEVPVKPLNQSLLAKLDISRVIPVDFSAKEVSVGEKNYGSWSFNLSPAKGGIKLNNIIAETRGLNIGGIADEGKTSEFIWEQQDGSNHSSFTGNLTAQNIAEVTHAWGQAEYVKSRNAEIKMAAHWPGAPDELSLARIEGMVSVLIEDGNFVRGAEAGENPILRLIALFNFDTLARRLRLDFSDLAKEGFAFDKVEGNLEFKNGSIYLDEALKVESTSSSMQLSGVIDLASEELDADLVVTLPVASNLAVLTALSAGLPAGVGVYLVSKLFKKQVDKVSSISYSLSGKWSDPKIKVQRVFNNTSKTAVKKKSEESETHTTGGDAAVLR